MTYRCKQRATGEDGMGYEPARQSPQLDHLDEATR